MEMKRLNNIVDICLKAAYKTADGPMSNIYHEALMASVEKELIEHTPECNLIQADIEEIRRAYCKLLNDADKMIKAYSE